MKVILMNEIPQILCYELSLIIKYYPQIPKHN